MSKKKADPADAFANDLANRTAGKILAQIEARQQQRQAALEADPEYHRRRGEFIADPRYAALSRDWQAKPDVRENRATLQQLYTLAEKYGMLMEPPEINESLWRDVQWIAANSRVSSNDIRTARHKNPDCIRMRKTPGKHPRYFLPDVVDVFPAKSRTLVK